MVALASASFSPEQNSEICSENKSPHAGAVAISNPVSGSDESSKIDASHSRAILFILLFFLIDAISISTEINRFDGFSECPFFEHRWNLGFRVVNSTLRQSQQDSH